MTDRTITPTDHPNLNEILLKSPIPHHNRLLSRTPPNQLVESIKLYEKIDSKTSTLKSTETDKKLEEIKLILDALSNPKEAARLIFSELSLIAEKNEGEDVIKQTDLKGDGSSKSRLSESETVVSGSSTLLNLSFFVNFEDSVKKITIPIIKKRISTTNTLASTKKEISSQENVKKIIIEQLISNKSSTITTDSKIFESTDLFLKNASMGDYCKMEEFNFEAVNENDVVYVQMTVPSSPYDWVKRYMEQSMGEVSRELKEIRRIISHDSHNNSNINERENRKSSSHKSSSNLLKSTSTNLLNRNSFDKSITRPSSAQLYSLLKSSSTVLISSSTADNIPSKTKNIKEKAELDKQFLQIKSLKHELVVYKRTYKKFEEEMIGTLNELMKQIRLVRENELKNNEESQRKILVSAKNRMKSQSDVLRKKIEDINLIVEELKLDVTVRKVKPTKRKLEMIEIELNESQIAMEEFCDFVDEVKPTWKSIWEKELQNIVKEQNFLKEQEGLSNDMEDDQNQLTTVFDTLQQLIKLQAAQRPRKESIRIEVFSPEEMKMEGLGNMLQEIQMSVGEGDSLKRMDALDKSFRLREFDRKQEVNEFKEELQRFVHESKLKKIN